MADLSPPRPMFLALTVYKREVKHYFHTPGTYVALAFFFILSGAIFVQSVSDYLEISTRVTSGAVVDLDAVSLNMTENVVTQLFRALNFLMLFVMPMLTMRLIAEEKKTGTFELLVSTPLGNWDILLGKFFAALTIGFLILLVCAAYPWICGIYGDPEGPVVLSCYLGLLLIIGAYTAFGLFASSLSESQIAAGVLSFVGLLLFHLVGYLFKAGKLGVLATALSVNHHSDNFAKGHVALEDVAYFFLFIAFFLFLTAQILDARRWRA